MSAGSSPNYRTITYALKFGNAVPFLGAGASRVGYQQGDVTFLPSAFDLAKSLAKLSELADVDEADLKDLKKISSFCVDASNRRVLRQKLRDVFANKKYTCNALHRFLAQVANNMMVVTTNYDTLLEQAFLEANKPYDLYVYPADNEAFGNAILRWRHGADEPERLKPQDIDVEDLGSTNVIYKMHGSVRAGAGNDPAGGPGDPGKWDGFVITEEDYIDFLSRMDTAVPAAFSTYFSSRSFLFLGYGLGDWNLRVLLSRLRGSSARPKNWAVLLGSSNFDRQLWSRRGVDMYPMKLEEFVVEMQNEWDKPAHE